MAAGFVTGGYGLVGRPQAARQICARGTVRMMADGDGQQGGNKPFGMFGQMGKIMDAVKKAQEFTKDAKSLQEEMARTELEASVRDGLVKVKITGNQVPVSVEISPELLKQDISEINAACLEAFKEAHRLSMEHMQTNLSNLTSSFGLPSNMPPPMK
eukprot:Plantae.Rhodophyta-Purpureofilum_apyrenoidigerum.ctg11175.p2 GENE.Plantae.Rhodophyta-Purpureofilum_apyrenoidigerum.ctg11175~~Plantae.Rhodophyta-Purpureofilum_apyrenoidigerum.ctg11175.p2  ORF type:complete len:183 (-),score=45.70 Plantae.Rhodophyta-Purpureofilum_apyrenoidigerum.ctg11175:273-743(-)